MLNGPSYGIMLEVTKIFEGRLIVRLVAEYLTTFVSVYSAITFFNILLGFRLARQSRKLYDYRRILVRTTHRIN